eukprot:266740_1
MSVEAQFQTHETPKDDGANISLFAKISPKELLKSIVPHHCLLTFGYMRENTYNRALIPLSIMNYITIFAFCSPPYQYESDFDENGIVYAIATNYGLFPWVNPATQGLITIQSSAWSSGGGKIEDVLARTKVDGYHGSCNTKHTWLSVDFGAKKAIKPSHYTLRNDGSKGYYLRKWNLEGSNDGLRWNALIKHENDINLNSAYATHTWSIDSDEYYRMFRILMTGENSGFTWHLVCSGFEVYGHLTDVLNN